MKTFIDQRFFCILTEYTEILFFRFLSERLFIFKQRLADVHQPKQLQGFADLGKPNKIWAIPAIHSAVDKLLPLHDAILDNIQPGDRIVYHGNYTGYGAQAVDTVEEILAFRRLVLAMPGMIPSDFIYLRGTQEEMLNKLLQLQFAPNPSDVLLWMLGNGISSTLQAYGISPHDGIEACRRGIMDLTRWTNSIRLRIRAHDGHETWMNQMKRAAYTQEGSVEAPLLFIHAGLNANKPLNDQGDSLWWDGECFESIQHAYKPFNKVIRGYDPAHKGMRMNCITATLDDGCGFGGQLVCAGFDQSGQVDTFFER